MYDDEDMTDVMRALRAANPVDATALSADTHRRMAANRRSTKAATETTASASAFELPSRGLGWVPKRVERITAVAVMAAVLLIGGAALVERVRAPAAAADGSSAESAVVDRSGSERPSETLEQVAARLYDRFDMHIFLRDDITESQRRSLRQLLIDDPAVDEVVFESTAGSYDNAREIFAADASVLDAIEPGDLPASFRIALDDRSQVEAVRLRVADRSGVDEVVIEPAGEPQATTSGEDTMSPRTPSDIGTGEPPPVEPSADMAKRLEEIYGGHFMSVFLLDDISAADRRDLARRLRADPAVDTVTFESQKDAYANSKQVFADSPEILSDLGPGDLPASFRVVLRDSDAMERLLEQYSRHAGVEEVVDDLEGTGESIPSDAE